jgi:hypothetical protein
LKLLFVDLPPPKILRLEIGLGKPLSNLPFIVKIAGERIAVLRGLPK